MSIGDLKEFYDIYIFIIDKEYLVYNVNMDVLYYLNYFYK